jgi:hypothetical protein
MVEESKDVGPHGFERGQFLKLVVRLLFNQSEAKQSLLLSLLKQYTVREK